MPASAVIPAPIVYTNTAAVKKLVVTTEIQCGPHTRGQGGFKILQVAGRDPSESVSPVFLLKHSWCSERG